MTHALTVPKYGKQTLVLSLGLQEESVRVSKAVAVALFSLLWEGVPFAMLGMSKFTGLIACMFIIILGVISCFVKYIKFGEKFNVWHKLPLILFLWCIIVTVLSSILFFRNPAKEWIFALKDYSPILLIYLVKALDIRVGEFLSGLLLSSCFAAFLVLVDRFIPLSFMEQYLTVSGFEVGARRIMLLKNEIALGLVISIARIVVRRHLAERVLYMATAGLLGYDLIVVTEVRLVIGAVLLATTFYFILFVRNVWYVLCLGVGAFTAGPIIFAKYIDRIIATQGNYATADVGVAWRLTTLDYYQKYFDMTHGLGFGIMPTGKGYDNLITFSLFKAPLQFGVEDWVLFLADISYYSALFQFGYVGLIIVLYMSLKGSVTMVRLSTWNNMPYRHELFILGSLFFFLTIASPWPLNFFTLSWSMMGGNIMWSLAARYSEVSSSIAPMKLRRKPVS